MSVYATPVCIGAKILPDLVGFSDIGLSRTV
jgi:hypothetical protein